MSRAITVQTVAELVPVAEAALASFDHEATVATIRRALLRDVGNDVYGACDIAAEAITCLAEERHEPPALGEIRLASDFSDNQPLGGRHG